MNHQYDVVINGAGMVGAVTALLLAEQGHQVAVIEAQQPVVYNPTDLHTMRVSAISMHNLNVFNRLNMLQHMSIERMGYYHNMVVWDNHSTGEMDFNGHRKHADFMGAMVENNHLILAAQTELERHPGIATFYETSIDSFEQSDRKVRVTFSDQTSIQALLLVGADGARSAIRSQADLGWHQRPYQQHGLVCYIDIKDAPEKTALQAFNKGGPVGLLPMNDGLFSVVWSMPDEQVKGWLEADDAYFVNGLRAHINRHLGDIELRSERLAFPLIKARADRFFTGRVVLVGDAAHTIHPLAGQGVNLGFADAEMLAQQLEGVSLKKVDELILPLKKYQRIRKAEVSKTSLTMDALHHLFTQEVAPLKLLRAFGMNRINQINPLKTWLLRQAGS